jgi:hypothetical protein
MTSTVRIFIYDDQSELAGRVGAFAPNPILAGQCFFPFVFIIAHHWRIAVSVGLHFLKDAFELWFKVFNSMRYKRQPKLHGRQHSGLESDFVLARVRRPRAIGLYDTRKLLVSPGNLACPTFCQRSEQFRVNGNSLYLVEVGNAVRERRHACKTPLPHPLKLLALQSSVCRSPDKPYCKRVVLEIIENESSHFIPLAIGDFLSCADLPTDGFPSNECGDNGHTSTNDAAGKPKPLLATALSNCFSERWDIVGRPKAGYPDDVEDNKRHPKRKTVTTHKVKLPCMQLLVERVAP